MATPFFRGNYGSALSRVDTRPITEAGRARGQMFAGLGKEVGGMIKEYGLNKQKRQVLTDKIEGTLDLYPEYAVQLTSSGDETSDKKNQTTLDKLAKGELGLSALQGLAGKLALMEKKDLKDQKERIASQNARLLEANILGKEQANVTEKELAKLKEVDRQRTEKFYESAENRLNDLTVAVGSGQKEFNDLSHFDRFTLGNAPGIRSRTIPKENLFYDPQAELDDKKTKLEFQSLVRKDAEEKKESVRKPEFISKDKAQEYAQNLPEGFSAKIVSDKDGYRADLVVSEKERVKEIPSIPGYPNYKIVGGYVYEGDPKTGKLSKLGSDIIGKDTELLIKVIDALNTKDVETYRVALTIGTKDEDDGIIEFKDPNTNETRSIPIDAIKERKIKEIDDYMSLMKQTIPNLLDMRTR